MSNLFRLTNRQMKIIRHLFPNPRGRPKADDMKVPGGLIFVNRNGLRWCDSGVFRRMLEALARADGDANDMLMIDATQPRPTARHRA